MKHPLDVVRVGAWNSLTDARFSCMIRSFAGILFIICMLPGRGPTGFGAQPRIRGQLGFWGHLCLKTGLQDGGDETWTTKVDAIHIVYILVLIRSHLHISYGIGRTVPLLQPTQSSHCCLGVVDHAKHFSPTPGHSASLVLSRLSGH